MITYGKQYTDNNDVKLVGNSILNKLLTSGKFLRIFEKRIKNNVKSKYSLACSNGTSALYLAFVALNIKKNDVVVMPAVNFVASANIASFFGCNIIFADIDIDTGQMSPQTLVECIKKNKLKKISLLITMYMGGHPKNIEEFYKLKNKYKFKILEDACHAFGSSYKSKYLFNKVGSCKHSDICAFSFHPLKTITSGEGGCLTTNNQSFYNTAKVARNHGFDSNNKYHWKYNLKFPSFNFRLNELSCALGVSQLKKLSFFLKKRNLIAKNYDFLFKNEDIFNKIITTPKINEQKKLRSSWHLYSIFINFKKLKTNKDQLIKFLLKNKVRVQFHYTPIVNFKHFKKPIRNYPNALLYSSSVISLPIFVLILVRMYIKMNFYWKFLLYLQLKES